MIWFIIKKQGLILWRNPTQLMLLIALPMILIVILSLSLGSFIGGNSVSIDAKIAMIDEGDKEKQLQDFEVLLENKGVPEKEQEAILQGAASFDPVEAFQKNVIDRNQDIITLKRIESTDKEDALNDDAFSAVIEVPDQFLYETWGYTFLDEQEAADWNIYYDEAGSTATAVVKESLATFQEQLTFSRYAVEEGKDLEAIFATSTSFGKETTVGESNVIQAQDYYAVGMAVMNVLFIASTISSFAFMEKEYHIFNRIILANVSGREYFSGIFLGGTFFGLIQLLLIYAFAWIVFGVTWPNIGLFIAITIALAFAVGGFAVLLSTITYRLDSETISNLFSSVIVSVLALLGGSFFPIGDLSDIFRIVGSYTPNGAAMSAYLEVLKGNSGPDIWKHIAVLIGFSIVLLGIAIGLYPKRRRNE